MKWSLTKRGRHHWLNGMAEWFLNDEVELYCLVVAMRVARGRWQRYIRCLVRMSAPAFLCVFPMDRLGVYSMTKGNADDEICSHIPSTQ